MNSPAPLCLPHDLGRESCCLPQVGRTPGPRGRGCTSATTERKGPELSVRREPSILEQGDEGSSPWIPHKAGAMMSEGIIHTLDPHQGRFNLEGRVYKGENLQSAQSQQINPQTG